MNTLALYEKEKKMHQELFAQLYHKTKDIIDVLHDIDTRISKHRAKIWVCRQNFTKKVTRF
jgi:hypothetical protein